MFHTRALASIVKRRPRSPDPPPAPRCRSPRGPPPSPPHCIFNPIFLTHNRVRAQYQTQNTISTRASRTYSATRHCTYPIGTHRLHACLLQIEHAREGAPGQHQHIPHRTTKNTHNKNASKLTRGNAVYCVNRNEVLRIGIAEQCEQQNGRMGGSGSGAKSSAVASAIGNLSNQHQHRRRCRGGAHAHVKVCGANSEPNLTTRSANTLWPRPLRRLVSPVWHCYHAHTHTHPHTSAPHTRHTFPAKALACIYTVSVERKITTEKRVRHVPPSCWCVLPPN